MARVTVEDCVLKVPNRFELVLLAAQRARAITSGASLTLDRDNDKNPVVALREIADETVELDHLKDSVVRGMQKHVELDEPEEARELEIESSLFGGIPLAGAEGEAEEALGEEAEESEEEEAIEEEIEEDLLSVDEGAEESEISEDDLSGADDVDDDVDNEEP